MNLRKKKQLAAKTFGVGESRIALNINRLDEIKDAITKQDMRDLKASGAIIIKEIKGTLKKQGRKTRRRAGSVRKKVKTEKTDYVLLVRKLRAYLAELKKHGKVSPEDYRILRKEIKAKAYKGKTHLKERLGQ